MWDKFAITSTEDIRADIHQKWIEMRIEATLDECTVLTRNNGGIRRLIQILRMLDRKSIVSDVQSVSDIANQANAVLIASHHVRVFHDHVIIVYQFIALLQKNVYSSLEYKKIYYNLILILSLYIFNIHLIIFLLLSLFFQWFSFLVYFYFYFFTHCCHRIMYNTLQFYYILTRFRAKNTWRKYFQCNYFLQFLTAPDFFNNSFKYFHCTQQSMSDLD